MTCDLHCVRSATARAADAQATCSSVGSVAVPPGQRAQRLGLVLNPELLGASLERRGRLAGEEPGGDLGQHPMPLDPQPHPLCRSAAAAAQDALDERQYAVVRAADEGDGRPRTPLLCLGARRKRRDLGNEPPIDTVLVGSGDSDTRCEIMLDFLSCSR